MIQAGSVGLPFTGVRGLLGTDILRNRTDLRVIPNPFQPAEEVAVVPGLRPDVAVFHALKADRWGDAITPGLRDDLLLARAARRVVVTAEEIVDGELFPHEAAGHTFLPALDVDGVVHLPGGAHPTACGPLYKADAGHIKEYIQACQEERTLQEYLDRYIYNLENHEQYLKKVGVAIH